jgi:hypothetical protein
LYRTPRRPLRGSGCEYRAFIAYDGLSALLKGLRDMEQMKDPGSADQINQQKVTREEYNDINYKRQKLDAGMREEHYRKNADKMTAVKKTMKLLFVIGVSPTAFLWVFLLVYNLIKVLALFAGAGMYFTEFAIAKEMGAKYEKSPAYDYPYILMIYLFVITVLIILGTAFKKRGVDNALGVIYPATIIYGIITAATGFESFLFSMLIILYGLFGIWLVSKILNQLDDIKTLEREEGYPDFLISVDEMRTVANTNGIFVKQLDEQKKKDTGRTVNDLGIALITNHNVSDIPVGQMGELSVELEKPIDEYLQAAAEG